ncbi:TonB-dependent receptor [Paracidobacterium acidisoli]|uniref:TonB-dependent receptor n=1 Tax=Paracidobacterium acidisoli TaxID=2303751 RepID=A0A372IV95_9BACT|nr:TonB-dependent receptor [Paracidobacterium acidisoli]MBT9329882.1 TonB-dependent receptor [Paracidobacterium acidisoli]
MFQRFSRVLFSAAFLFSIHILFGPAGFAQQTLGGITGAVTDATGGALPDTAVTAVSDQTRLTRKATSNASGTYEFVNLPIGTYSVTFVHDGFDTQQIPSLLVQADRTATLNVTLRVGQVSTSVTVEATPLLNAVDTTNGYVLDKAQIDAVPLATGSFTGLAILSPGVNAELGGGTGVNSGLGNAPIWANGQRDTSNSVLLNGVDASNFFNGKTTSQVQSARVVLDTGSGNSSAGVEQSASSVYLSIGNAIPTPAPETVQEVRVNASMYDAQQGSASGAHIDMSTISGGNNWHGSLYGHRGTSWLNAAPFFFKNNTGIPDEDKNPQLHRYVAGGTFSGPIIRNKLFGFVAYQHMHVSDQETGDTLIAVPPGLNDTNRTADGLATLVNNNWSDTDNTNGFTVSSADWSNNPLGLALFQAKLPNGQWLIPNDNHHVPDALSPSNAFETGTSYFTVDQAIANLDWNTTATDQISLKYYYQHDPNSTPYATSNVPGFTEHLDAGSQVFSVTNIQTLSSSFSLTETLGFIREKAYSTNDQLWAPGQAGTPAADMTSSFGSYFPGITIVDILGAYGSSLGLPQQSLSIGPSTTNQSAYTGMFQNRIQPSANAIWTKGAHSLTFGGSWSYTQLNIRDLRTGKGLVATPDLSTYAMNWVTPYTTDGFVATTFLQGNANRYYRANTSGLYLQDKYQIRPNLSITAGIRYDWNGGLTEKYGNLFNFDPSQYSYDAGSDAITKPGLIIAGNNRNGTSGVSNTTLTGRQWGIAPRLGFAWQPSMLHNKLVVRGGTGMYYDRGELYTYLSPGYAAGEVAGGPFGVSQTPPFVTGQGCPYTASPYGNTSFLYNYYIPICGLTPFKPVDGSQLDYNLSNPWGMTRSAPPSNPKASDLINYLPDAAGIIAGAEPFTLGNYNRTNKLPYSINFTLDLQWQPRNDLMVELGYVGNLGRHQVIPVPFNQAHIAAPGNPTHPGGVAQQSFSYGYTVLDPNTFFPVCVNLNPSCSYGTMQENYEGGNVDLRVPYIGYSSESESYTAAGISAYHALQAHVEKRLSHGIQAGVSYTYSHATDEQSALGLFYNGSNPLNLRSGYGSADFDRTHVLNFTYGFSLPKLFSESTLQGKLINDWSLNGLAIIQSGQPYSVIDYSGAVGSIYYSTFNGITNPIVPLAPGCTAKSALTGHSGAFYRDSDPNSAALKSSCFTLPLLASGSNGVPAGDIYETGFTSGQRNIFRQAFQKRADASLVKTLRIRDRYALRYTFDVYNLTNTSSFDIPGDDVTQNAGYNNVPTLNAYQAAAPPQGACTNPGSFNASDYFYSCPTGLGIVKHTIGAPRQIQMSLHLSF